MLSVARKTLHLVMTSSSSRLNVLLVGRAMSRPSLRVLLLQSSYNNSSFIEAVMENLTRFSPESLESVTPASSIRSRTMVPFLLKPGALQSYPALELLQLPVLFRKILSTASAILSASTRSSTPRKVSQCNKLVVALSVVPWKNLWNERVDSIINL